MLEAQEMFRTANKVTRPEKALILGFMAGSRGEYAFLYHIDIVPIHMPFMDQMKDGFQNECDVVNQLFIIKMFTNF
jgi:hypothetical protein